VWIAVSGRLARTTAPLLSRALHLRAAEGFTALFVDVSTLVDDYDCPVEEVRDGFPCDERLAFHIIGPAGGLRLQPGRDPRFFFHTGPASAWTAWEHGPCSTLGSLGPKGPRSRMPARPYS
jgi:hypothetical protein